ncbi:hypothetical protein ESCO_003899 [Escovopsis weberi]|uniref:DUF7053 domain-containing protein n=1 Tax=Escovopsis weberi TaxID=150374 RepID=A0A0M9VX79_ESCWE|nr:hypothetical protein ESCO_003899 [Escovopsis weberi]
MSKRTVFTSITPLPAGIPRQLAIDFLHNHAAMIDLNPLVTARRRIPAPAHALPDERACAWYAITDRIAYLPGGLASGAVEYTAAFHDLPHGLQTHCHAPMGVDLRERWTVGGTLPGEPPEPVEIGLGAPPDGLYIREDVELRCSIVMAAFVKKTLKKAHGTVVRALAERAMLDAAYKGEVRSAHFDLMLRSPVPQARPTSWGGGGGGGRVLHEGLRATGSGFYQLEMANRSF